MKREVELIAEPGQWVEVETVSGWRRAQVLTAMKPNRREEIKTAMADIADCIGYDVPLPIEWLMPETEQLAPTVSEILALLESDKKLQQVEAERGLVLVKTGRNPMADLRRLIYRRQDKTCPICTMPMQVEGRVNHGMTLHHIEPKSQGGRWVPSNLVGLHRSCHDAIENEGDPRHWIATERLEAYLKASEFHTPEQIRSDFANRTHPEILLAEGRAELGEIIRARREQP